jgi:hypothetical protein
LISTVFLGIRILFSPAAKFPQHRIGHNKEMRKKEIYCPRTLDKLERKNCAGCSYFQESI